NRGQARGSFRNPTASHDSRQNEARAGRSRDPLRRPGAQSRGGGDTDGCQPKCGAVATVPRAQRAGAARGRETANIMTKYDDLEREARRVLEPLRYSPVAVSSSSEVEAGREATVPRLAALIQDVPIERTKRLERERTLKVLRFAVGGAVALAAGAFLWFGSESGDQARAQA